MSLSIETLIVHSGVFHADDVMCAALAKCINNDVVILRMQTPPITLGKNTVVADFGGGAYDHHQPDARMRKNGAPYAACGLLFEDIWDQLFPDRQSADAFATKYILPIEAQDNGGARNPLSEAVKALNPVGQSEADPDALFFVAVDFFVDMVKAEMRRAVWACEAKSRIDKTVKDAKDKRIIVLDEYLPWREQLSGTCVQIVAYPSARGGWNLQRNPCCTCKPVCLSFAAKLPGCTFTHSSGFLAAFNTKENALEAAAFLARPVLPSQADGR